MKKATGTIIRINIQNCNFAVTLPEGNFLFHDEKELTEK